MTLEEVIKHCEGVALQKDIEAEEHNPRYTGLIRECKEYAAEHRQLAEWLKELKERREQDVPDINVGDMVSRQKAIDALCRRCDLAAEDDEPCTEKCNDIKILEKLPSAQPEVIRCKDCEYGEQDDIGRWFCNDLGCQIGSDDGSGYCADAERRTDD